MNSPLLSIRVPEDIVDRIPAVLKGGEIRSAFVREAMIRELERREAILAKRPMAIERFED
jgi:metal-responsive CopG/Arc/MetJ family transcriptional regulator